MNKKIQEAGDGITENKIFGLRPPDSGLRLQFLEEICLKII